MKLTPLDIRKQEFKKTMRGFDPEEVEAFLVMVADELELHIREKNQLNDELIRLRTQLKDYQRVESTLRDTLVRAQSTVEDSRANSRREAEIIIHEAEIQADNIIKEAREELLSIRHEISLLRAQKEAIAKRLRHMLESQLEMLEVMEIEDFRHMDSRRPNESEAPPAKRRETSPSMRTTGTEDDSKPRIVGVQRPASPSSGVNMSKNSQISRNPKDSRPPKDLPSSRT
ncbi:DivIVA domain-containing protein [candidate division KSB1 bacterium]|nr:DivIVA domain-containing protein [candidate division KSB1 bacterium]